MALYNYEYKDIIEALQESGVQKGDTVFLHSNVGFFGRMKDIKTADDLCEMFFRALKEVLGEEGTLVVPTFSYSFCHGEYYNPAETVSGCGMFSEYMRKQTGVIRSLDPNFSVAAYGRLAEVYTKNPAHESFGKGSFWERFLENKGKIMCMNMDCGSTFVHYVENLNEVPYRYNKAFNGVLTDYEGKEIRDYFVHYVYALEKPEDGPFFGRLDRKCHEKDLCKTADLGKGTLLTMDAGEYLNLITETLRTEPRFLTIGGDVNE